MKYALTSYIGGVLAGLLLGLMLFGRGSSGSTPESRTADSTIAVVTPHLVKTDSVLVRDTTRVVRYLTAYHTDTLWRRDTVLSKDSTPSFVVPLPTVVRWDSTAKACSELAVDCAAFRKDALALLHADSIKIGVLEGKPERSCKTAFFVGLGLGGAGGAYISKR